LVARARGGAHTPRSAASRGRGGRRGAVGRARRGPRRRGAPHGKPGPARARGGRGADDGRRGVRAPRARGDRPRARRRGARGRAAREAHPPGDGRSRSLEVPEDPEALWSASLRDPGLLDADTRADALPVAAVVAEGDAVYVSLDRSVRRLDAATGLKRWQFPA